MFCVCLKRFRVVQYLGSLGCFGGGFESVSNVENCSLCGPFLRTLHTQQAVRMFCVHVSKTVCSQQFIFVIGNQAAHPRDPCPFFLLCVRFTRHSAQPVPIVVWQAFNKERDVFSFVFVFTRHAPPPPHSPRPPLGLCPASL